MHGHSSKTRRRHQFLIGVSGGASKIGQFHLAR